MFSRPKMSSRNLPAGLVRLILVNLQDVYKGYLGDRTAGSQMRHDLIHDSTIAGLAGALTSDQLLQFVQLDGRTAARLVERIRSWLHWNPVSTNFGTVLECVATRPWFTVGQQQWATRLLQMPWAHPLSGDFAEQADREREQRALLRPRHLLAIPAEIAANAHPSFFTEAHLGLPKCIAWCYLAEWMPVFDVVLEHPTVRALPNPPIGHAKRYASEPLRISLRIAHRH